MTNEQRRGTPAGNPGGLRDTGERMIPTAPGEISFTHARHAFAYRYACTWAEGKNVLDIGCGTGYGARILSSHACAVTAVDQSEEAITYCRTFYASPHIDFRVGRADQLSFPAPFDVGVCFQVIEHLSDPANFLAHLRRTITAGGMILITTPNIRNGRPPLERNQFHSHEMTHSEFSALLTLSFSSYQLLGIAPSDAPLWRKAMRQLPFYRWGRGISRTSPLKKLADRALDLTSFRVIERNVATDAIDLLAVCVNA